MTLSRAAFGPALVGLALTGLLGGCGDNGDGGAAAADPSFRVERHTWGGMCASGPCRSTWLVEPDGGWTLRTEADNDSGRLSGDELDALYRAVESTELDSAPPTTSCEADADGTSVRYVWTVRGETSTASSCEVELDAADALVETVEELLPKE